jgi:hypothetical protein
MYFSEILQNSTRTLSLLHINCVLLIFHYGNTVMRGLRVGFLLYVFLGRFDYFGFSY